MLCFLWQPDGFVEKEAVLIGASKGPVEDLEAELGLDIRIEPNLNEIPVAHPFE
jgi:hypothetical protein